MKTTIAVLILSILLVGCASPVTPMPPTEIPTATVEPSPIPVVMADIDLKGLAFEEGDLPAGFEPGQALSEMPGWYSRYKGPKPENNLMYTIGKNGDSAGYVTIALFNNLENIEWCYKIMVSSTGKKMVQVEGIGDKAEYLSTGIPGMNSTLIFRRCSAVVMVATGTSQFETEVYSKNLDARLKDILCP